MLLPRPRIPGGRGLLRSADFSFALQGIRPFLANYGLLEGAMFRSFDGGLVLGKSRVAVIGGGPGGLAAAMLLAHWGFEVDVFEKGDQVGGRNAALRRDGFTFDVGPTLLMMRFVLDELFAATGRSSEDYLDMVPLDPMYLLDYGDDHILSYRSDEGMGGEIARVFDEGPEGVEKFYRREGRRFEELLPALQRPCDRLGDLVSREALKAFRQLAPGRSLFDVLGDYFSDDRLKLAFAFQAIYLGMSPWACPGAFAIIPFIEHKFGVYHVMGGLNRIPAAMARVVEEEGGRIHLGSEVEELVLEGRRARGVELVSGELVEADFILVNADFGHAMLHLVAPGVLKKYSPHKLARKRYSCSTFMMYLGIEGKVDIPHHSIYFARDSRSSADDIFERLTASEDPSVYVQNASATDPSLAPEGYSTLYVLVPVPNNEAEIDWKTFGIHYRERVLDVLEERIPLPDLRSRIRTEAIVDPEGWEKEHSIYRGATFNLGHNLGQMLYFRPHNRFEELERVYLAGGGTHPGSGLPTIWESGRISAQLIREADDALGA